jgi:predicted O-linked N-acetylglucosamine transferase (SPINDLY family)
MSKLSITELFREADRLETAGDIAGAVTLYKSWVALNAADPHLHAACFNYAVVLSRAGDKMGAINTLRDTIRIKPDFQPPYINLGRLLEDIGQSGSAVTQWLELVKRLSALNGETLKHKLMALQQIGRVLENNHVDASAEDALRQSIELKPGQHEVVQHWLALRQKQCKWPVIESWEGVSKQELVASISPLSAAVMLDDPMFQLARAWRYAKDTIGIPQSPPPDHSTRRGTRPARLKIGYVSSDLREHAVGFGLSEALELHDRSRFDIHAYYCGIARDDATKTRIRSAVGHWTDITGMSDDAAACKIAEDGIDILIDVNGYTRDARTAVFARKAAPIQVNWYGFPGTMGTPYHHYIIADPHVLPEENERYFSEKVMRIPCYQPNDRSRVVSEQVPLRIEENLPEEGFVFCCLNGSQKNTPEMFGAWMRILRAVPGSVLWLLDSIPTTNDRLRQLAEQNGIEPDRIRFAPKRSNPQHLARYLHAGLFLDTFPYGAHTTASDAMWMGVPVLTMPGQTFASRVCAGLVTAAGLPELVCTSLDEYVNRAVAIARDHMLATSLRNQLEKNRGKAILFDTDCLVRSLESVYDLMWSDFEAGRLPVPDLRNLDIYEEIGIALHSEEQVIGDWRQCYEDRLAQWNAVYPIPPDNRLWTKHNVPIPITRYKDRARQIAADESETPNPLWLERAASAGS